MSGRSRIRTSGRRERWRRAAWRAARQGSDDKALALQRALVAAGGRTGPVEELRDLFRLLRWEVVAGSWGGVLKCAEKLAARLSRRALLRGPLAGYLNLARVVAQLHGGVGPRHRRSLAAVLRPALRGRSRVLLAQALEIATILRAAADPGRGPSGAAARLLGLAPDLPSRQLPALLPRTGEEEGPGRTRAASPGRWDPSPAPRLRGWHWGRLSSEIGGPREGAAAAGGTSPEDLAASWLRAPGPDLAGAPPRWALPIIARRAAETAPVTAPEARCRLHRRLSALAAATAEPWPRAALLEACAEVSLWMAGDHVPGDSGAASTVHRARADLLVAAGLFRRLGWERRAARCETRWLRLRWPALGYAVSEDGPRDAAASGPARGEPAEVRRALSEAGFWTRDPRVLRDLAPLLLLAACPLPVLILGESGTGKEVVARALHRWSRVAGEFVAIHCGAIPRDLLESELFGHLRGAFTGASADKPGLVEAADGGTLFLDEIGEMGMEAQMKMLRVLESGEVRRLGDLRPRRARVRLVAATHRDLEAAVRTGGFRLDLYHRIRGIVVRLRPLRERRGDIPLLASRILRAADAGERPLQLSPEGVACLLGHPWPGNVRELKGTLQRAAHLARALGREAIAPELLGLGDPPDEIPADAVAIGGAPDPADGERLPTRERVSAAGLDAVLDEMERRLIVEALDAHRWNRTHAARALGNLSRTTLLSKMKRLGIEEAGLGPGGAGSPDAGGEPVGADGEARGETSGEVRAVWARGAPSGRPRVGPAG